MISLRELQQVTRFLAGRPMDLVQRSASVVGELVAVARLLLAAVLLSRLLHAVSSEVGVSVEGLALAAVPAVSSLEGHNELRWLRWLSMHADHASGGKRECKMV